MGFLSKLLKSNSPTADDAEPEPTASASADASAPAPAPPELIATPVMMPAYVPPDARPTPTDIYDRPTMRQLEPVVVEERPTVVQPAAAVASLAKESAAAPPSTPNPPLPRPPRPIARAEPRPDSPSGDRPATLPMSAPEAKPRTRAATDGAKVVARAEAGRRAPLAGKLKVDLTDVRALFGQLATNHMRQVRDFLIELRWGPTSASWVAICAPAVESLRDAAEKLEFADLAMGLRDFAGAMYALDLTTTSSIEGAGRERILAAYAALEAVLPETFALDGARSQREAAILHALLSQIPEVHKVTIDKLYAAGLTTLETMLLARTEDLVATTGIPEVLADRIVERFRRYRQEMASAVVDESRAGERSAIASLVAELRRQNDEFDQAAAGWTNEAIQRKKDILVARAQTMLAIDLHLARLGEIALVRELERLPFSRKVSELDAFLAAASAKYAAPLRSAAEGAPAEPPTAGKARPRR